MKSLNSQTFLVDAQTSFYKKGVVRKSPPGPPESQKVPLNCMILGSLMSYGVGKVPLKVPLSPPESPELHDSREFDELWCRIESPLKVPLNCMILGSLSDDGADVFTPNVFIEGV